jgi:acetyl esterase/lipase
LNAQLFEDIPHIIDFGLHLENIDPERVGFMGFSFGAQVALSIAYKDERIKAVVSQSSPSDMNANFGRKPENLFARVALMWLKLMGVKAKKMPDELNELASPAFNLDPARDDLNSRVFLINAEDDSIISFKEFEKNRDMLQLPDDHYLAFKKGNHIGIRQELLTIAGALRFFKSKL